MPYKCCVPGCRSNYDRLSSKVSVFSFPKDLNRAQIWLRAIDRSDYELTKSSKVCIEHFDERFIIREDIATQPDGSVLIVKRDHFKLSDDAVPTIFEKLSPYLSKQLPPKRKRPEQRQLEHQKKKDPLYLGDSRLVYEQHSERLTVSSAASTSGSRTTTTLAGQGHDSDVGATQSQDFSDPDDPTDNTAFMDSLQPSDIDIDVGPIFETIEIKPNIELDNLPPPPPSPPPTRKRTAIPDIEVAEQEDPLATKRTRSSALVGYDEDGDKEDDDNFSGDEFDEEEDGDKVRRAYQLLKSVFDKKDKYDIFGHRLAARLRALKSAKVCRHVLDIMESVIDDAEAGKYNNV